MSPGQSDWDPDRERLADRLRPILGGLVAAAIVLLTLLATLVLAGEDQALVSNIAPTPTSTAPLPAATPSPSPTHSPSPTLTALQPALRATASSDASLFPTLSLAERIQLLPTRQSTPTPTASPSALPSPTTVRRASSASAAICRPPSNWRRYTIKRGDTLARLTRLFGVSTTRLKAANCLTSNKLRVGATLWVPRVSQAPPPKNIPKPQPKPTKRPTIPPKKTNTPVPYGGAIVVPPELAGESPLPASNSQARPLAVFATGLLLVILAIVRLCASQQRSPSLSHRLGVYSANEQHETV